LPKTNLGVCFLPGPRAERVGTFCFDGDGLAAFCRQLRPDDEVAVEVGQNTPYFQDQIQDRVKRVVFVDPPRFALISRSKKKTDRHDASLLARVLKVGWLPTVPTPSPQIREVRTLLQARDNLVGRTTKLKNMGHGTFTRQGIRIEASAFASARGRHRLATTGELPDRERHILEVVLQQLEHLEQAIAAVETQSVEVGKDLPGLRRGLQIPALSLLGGIRLLAEIGDIHWFASAKQLGAEAGLVPTVRQSKETDRRGPITKQGRKRLRTLAIGAVWVMVRSGTSPVVAFYLLKKRQKGAGKALCAAARKLVGVLFVMLTKELDSWYLEERLYNKKLRGLQKAAEQEPTRKPLPRHQIVCGFFPNGLVFYRRYRTS
jgi:transposase